MLNYTKFYAKCKTLWALLGFPEALGHILLPCAQDNLRYSTGAHSHNSQLWGLHAGRLRVVPRQGTRGRGSRSMLGVQMPVSQLPARQMPNTVFTFLLVKVKILFIFLSTSENRYERFWSKLSSIMWSFQRCGCLYERERAGKIPRAGRKALFPPVS